MSTALIIVSVVMIFAGTANICTTDSMYRLKNSVRLLTVAYVLIAIGVLIDSDYFNIQLIVYIVLFFIFFKVISDNVLNTIKRNKNKNIEEESYD